MRITEVEQKIRAAIAPSSLAIVDQSHLHSGHAGDRPYGQSHYHAIITTSAFEGQNRVARQRMVYAALGSMVGNEVHALSMDLRTPKEG
jgi:BolA family transcriptional regulator, general stress-responsive regulator